MNPKKIRLALASIALVLLAACSAPKVNQEVEMPAREPGMTGAKKLAILNINGDRDGILTANVESYLANIRVRGKPYFEVLERQMLDRIVNEQRMVSSSGLFTETDAVKLGNLAGADTLMMGSVRIPEVMVRHYHVPETTCMERDKKGTCVRERTVHQACIEKSANVDFVLKAVSVQKGSIVFTKSYSGSARHDQCDGKGNTNTGMSTTDLMNAAVRQTLHTMRMDVAPYTVTVSIQFMDTDEVMSENTRGRLKTAMEFVEQKRIDRACDIFKQAVAGDTKSPALYYNMGVCAEIGSDFDKAESLYKNADSKTTRPVKLINEALDRVTAMRSSRTELGKQLR